MDGSIAFDRAAEYYDRTRGLSDAGVVRKTIDLLAGEFRDRGLVLEVGVGTGQLALPLHEAGIPVVGLDLASPMMDKLRGEGRGPLAVPARASGRDADAVPRRRVRSCLPAVGAAPDPRVAGCARRDRSGRRPGGVLLVRSDRRARRRRRRRSSGGSRSSPASRSSRRGSRGRATTSWTRRDRGRRGASDLPSFTEIERDGLDVFIDGIANNRYSWTWKIEDPALLGAHRDRRAPVGGGAVRSARPGPAGEYEMVWRAYDLPAGR